MKKELLETEEKMKDKTKDTILVPPDGGWGWVILTSAVLVNVLIPGTVKSFGVLFVEFLEVFQASPTTASWMPALCYFLYSSLGPLSSVLSMKYSYKTVTMVGGAFAASGMMFSYFATSVPYLYVSYGIMVGIGAGLTCPVSVYIVTEYFQKYRGFANGMCISGSCFGAIILPPLLQHLLNTVGYRGAVLIMGAITLNSVLCGLLYHPVERHMKRIPITSEKCGVDNKALTLDESSADITQSTNEENAKQISNQSIISADKINPTIREKDLNNKSLQLDRVINSEELILQPEKLDNKWCLQLNQNQSISIEVPMERYRKISRAEDKFTDSTTRITKTIEMSTSQMNEINRENSFFTASAQEKFTSLPIDDTPKSRVPRIFKSLCSKQFASKKNYNDEKSCEANFDPEKQDLPKKKKFFDLSILRDPIYLVILISNSTSAISNTNFMILLPSYAIAEGFDKNSAALLLSIVSALDLIGRIGGASLSDINFIPKYYYFVGGLGVSGIALALLPMFSSYRMLSFFCGLFGISSGTYIGITTVVLADMLGADRLSSSYGIALFVNGVLQLLGPPILGSIYEQTGTYKPIFLALGIILILGTSLWAIVPIVKRRKNKEVEEN
ncbi:monocarboxylate transporter 12-B-like isoform X2 [Leptopilina heterotoma]|uniref:monocarboxylate transporter 12-B-like isoform X2 n=2 Tax=Leptopilina heterotoma TaxID=63436 RepID=UPI001CA95FAC|nr:monocarboxylate transporter 12-B-like isoform X2 [Leptopilina heterotoma]